MNTALPSLDLGALDDAWAAVAALSSDDETQGERQALNAVCRTIEQLGGRNPKDQTREPYPDITTYRRYWGARLRVEMFGAEKELEMPAPFSAWRDEVAMNLRANGH